MADEVTCISSTSELHSADLLESKSTNDEALPDTSNVDSLDTVTLPGLDEQVDNSPSVTSNSDPPDSGTNTILASELTAAQPVDSVTDPALKESALHESIVCTLHRFVCPLIALFVNFQLHCIVKAALYIVYTCTCDFVVLEDYCSADLSSL